MLYNSDRQYYPIGTSHTLPFVLSPKDHSQNLIPFLSSGNSIPSDKVYIDAYKTVFEILKGIFHKPTGYINFIKQQYTSEFDTFFKDLYDDLIDGKKRTFSDYVESASIEIYDQVLGQERMVLSRLEENLIAFSKKNKLSKAKKAYLSQLLELISSGTNSQKTFTYTMIGKVLEGSLSQARKSLGGHFAEKIIYTLLLKQELQVSTQDGSETATNTDLLVTTEKYMHCIAVQLSTNDRMRLSKDEYRLTSINYLVSFNGCTVSKKGVTDISTQRMSSWMKASIEGSEVVPFYVGRDTFIQALKDKFGEDFLTKIKPYSAQNLDLNIELDELVKILNQTFKEKFPKPTKKLEELKTSMYLALWAYKYTLSFEEFIAKLKASD